ncbi:hypothetical protein, partial [uncultured Psychrosphaera sp.]|uniref:hypothetical protein n=1 Tax=uncultured Psychrosphaera sp. TaxID=1403522 RepID=UPI0030FBF251
FFPAVTALACITLIGLVMHRRKVFTLKTAENKCNSFLNRSGCPANLSLDRNELPRWSLPCHFRPFSFKAL